MPQLHHNNKQKQTYRLREQTYVFQGGKNGERDSKEAWNQHVHTAVFKMENQQDPTIWHMELCSVLCVA